MLRIALFALVISLFSGFAWSGEEGAKLFTDMKCTKCHSVESKGIKADADKDPDKISDLSNASVDFSDAAAVKSYIMRETELNGKKHKKKAKGDDADLDKLCEWLMTLKSE